MAQTTKQQAANFRLALEMYDFGVAMMRQNLRRKFPRASELELTKKLDAWLRREPDAPAAKHSKAQSATLDHDT